MSSYNYIEELYNDLIDYRLLIQDLNNDEINIIKELKIYLFQKRYNINDINNILLNFYQYFQIDININIIENSRILVFNNNSDINFLSNLINYESNIINNESNISNDESNIINNESNISNDESNIINDESNIFNDDSNISNNEFNISNRTFIFNEMNNDIYIYESNRENRTLINNESSIRNIISNDNLYDIISQFLNITNSLEVFEDVIVSLSNNDLKNLKTYENNNLNNINCCICMEDIQNKELISELNCTHQFHESCIKNYLDKYNYKCPICRNSAGNTKTNI